MSASVSEQWKASGSTKEGGSGEVTAGPHLCEEHLPSSGDGPPQKGCCCCRGCLNWGPALEGEYLSKDVEINKLRQQQVKGKGQQEASLQNGCSTFVARHGHLGGDSEDQIVTGRPQAIETERHRTCFCCLSQPEIAARRGLYRCCWCCPHNDCRVPIAQALERALGEGSLAETDADTFQPLLQPQQQEQQQQDQSSSGDSEGGEADAEGGTEGEADAETLEPPEPNADREKVKDTEAGGDGDTRRKEETAGVLGETNETVGSPETESTRETGGREQRAAEGETKECSTFPSLLRCIPGGDTSVLAGLIKLPQPAPPSVPQTVKTAWKPADTKVHLDVKPLHLKTQN